MLTDRPTQAGFSIIEIMVSIAIFGVLVALGGAPMMNAIHDIRIKAAAEGLREGLELARMEAIKRSETVELRLNRPTVGWTVVPVSSPGDILQARNAEEAGYGSEVKTIPPASSVVTFDSFGRRTNTNADGTATVVSIEVASVMRPEQTTAIRLEIGDGGTTRVCMPSAPPTSLRACS